LVALDVSLKQDVSLDAPLTFLLLLCYGRY